MRSGTPSGVSAFWWTHTHDMPATEHLLAEVHELGNTVLAIAHELVQLIRDKCDDLGFVQTQSAREAALRQRPRRREDQLILMSAGRADTYLLAGKEIHVLIRVIRSQYSQQCSRRRREQWS